MPTKLNSAGEQQEYDESTGRYGSGGGFKKFGKENDYKFTKSGQLLVKGRNFPAIDKSFFEKNKEKIEDFINNEYNIEKN